MNQKQFLSSLKSREDLITQTFYKVMQLNAGHRSNHQSWTDMLYNLFDAMKEQMVSLTRYHIRLRTQWNYRETSVMNSVQKIMTKLRAYQVQEEHDRLFQLNINEHMRELNVEMEQLTRTTVDYSEHQRPDFSNKEFSGVTHKLQEIGNEIQLAVDPSPQQSDSLAKLNIRVNEFTPFDVFEDQIKSNFVSIQNHTAYKVLKRFYRKVIPVDAEMQTEPEPVNRVIFALQEEINNLTKRLRRAEEDMIYNKLKAQTVEVVAKDTKEELKNV